MRDVARARQQRLFMLSGGLAVGLAALYLTGRSAVSAIQRAAEKPVMVATTDVRQQGAMRAPTAPTTAGVQQTPKMIDSAARMRADSSSRLAALPSATPSLAGARPAPRTAPLAIAVREGRSTLADSMVVERAGDSIVVDFDVQMQRTRQRAKFERIVRQTLPRVYDSRIATVLAAIPEGHLVADPDFLTELPRRGMHLPVGDGWMLDLWPETRQGRDGPLVVSYRVKLRQL